MDNIPHIKIGVVAVSRDCFPASLARSRLEALQQACVNKIKDEDIYFCPTIIVESESDMLTAYSQCLKAGCNALCVYLGNFGPEIAETLLAKHWAEFPGGPVMLMAAAEEENNDLHDSRGDAYCGLLNASYNLNIRGVKAYIPASPVVLPEDGAKELAYFHKIAKVIYGLKHLKIISFGPRPNNFLACNAPIKGFFDLGVEVEENSELDLFKSYKEHQLDSRIPSLIEEMKQELGEGHYLESILPKLAQYELTLLDWVRSHKGERDYVVLSTKCWPAFQTEFGFVPCYVNSRLAGKGYPVSCEVDLYGALSEWIGMVLSDDIPTLLDINNTVPSSIYDSDIKGKFPYKLSDLFMGFHCGNTCSAKLCHPHMANQRIMARTLPTEVTKGTIEGDIVPGKVTIFRLQGHVDGSLGSYVAEGEVLPVATRSFGSIGIFAIKEMGRFYRYELIANHFPHHAAVAFTHIGKELYDVFSYLGIRSIGYNRGKEDLYPEENPFLK